MQIDLGSVKYPLLTIVQRCYATTLSVVATVATYVRLYVLTCMYVAVAVGSSACVTNSKFVLHAVDRVVGLLRLLLSPRRAAAVHAIAVAAESLGMLGIYTYMHVTRTNLPA